MTMRGLMFAIRTMFVASVVLALAGCEVGKDYRAPEVTVPSDWAADEAKALSEKAEVDQQWWQNFNDPVLTQLIDRAAANSFDMKMAEARIAEARAGVEAAEASLLPSGDVRFNAIRQANQMAMPGNAQAELLRKPYNIYQTGFDASWELDLFGGNRRDSESAQALLHASEASRDDIRVSLFAEVARTYVALREAQAQLSIAESVTVTDKKGVALARGRYEAGQTPRLDVMQAEARLEQDQGQIPLLRNQCAQAEYKIDVLLGETPGFTHKLVAQPGAIPSSGKKLVLAAPASVIAQRPDLRVAERKLAAATAQQGAAMARFFPNVSLSGFFGFLNVSTTKLLTPGNKSWEAAGGVLWPILSYNSLSANLDAANAREQEALALYQKSVIAALVDVERALTAYTEQEKTLKSIVADVELTRRAHAVAEERFRHGLTSRLDVLEADRKVAAAKAKMMQALSGASQNLIALYKSLGGGWIKG
jgi:NodT family efflux transporter outer membrane factor (OMF) lipoprotein